MRDIANTGCFLPHRSSSVASNLRPVGCSAFGSSLPNIFRYANSHSTMNRASDVSAEIQRYFYGNYVYGSKIAAVFAVQPANAFTFRLECQLPGST